MKRELWRATHVVSGSQSPSDLQLPAKDGEPFMSEEHLALLKSVVIRPSRTIPPSIESLANALFDAGYVTRSPDGWTATAEGCNLVERKRTTMR